MRCRGYRYTCKGGGGKELLKSLDLDMNIDISQHPH